MSDQTAILIDGDFFVKRYRQLYKPDQMCAKTVVNFLIHDMCHKHLNTQDSPRKLYRIYYYDCKPFDKSIQNPISRRAVNFRNSPLYRFKLDLLEQLKKQRKVALRLGVLKSYNAWGIYPSQLKRLLKGSISISELEPTDLFFELSQKQVDMKIGLDIASIALKQQANQIVLVAGDSDFVPAAKLARREGIDFILDPMYNHIQPHLFEHIDGLISHCRKPEPSGAIAS